MTQPMESLIKTDAIEEACAFLEAWLFGNTTLKVWIQGSTGSGKSFLAEWTRKQAPNSKRFAIFDENAPDDDLPYWVRFTTLPPIENTGYEIVEINPPEYERKRGVLEEWAAFRGLRWQPCALETLLALKTDNLQLLRSLAQRTALEAGLTTDKIQDIDVIRTLSRAGYSMDSQTPLSIKSIHKLEAH